MHGGQAGNFLQLTEQQSAQAWRGDGDNANANAHDAVQLIVSQWQTGRLRVRRKLLVLGVCQE